MDSDSEYEDPDPDYEAEEEPPAPNWLFPLPPIPMGQEPSNEGSIVPTSQE